MSMPPRFSNVFKVVAFVALSIIIIGGSSYGIWVYVLNQKPPVLSGFFPTEQQISTAIYPKNAINDIKLKDGINGTAITSATLDIYTTGSYNNPSESVTTDGTTGIAVTGDKYTSGDTYTMHVVKSSVHLDYWTTWTVPNAVSATDTTCYSVVKAFTLGTLTITIADGVDGTTYADTALWNKTTGAHPGTASTTMAITIRNTVDNTGFWESTDPIYQTDYKLMLAIDLTPVSSGHYEQVSITAPSGANPQWQGTTRYWFVELPAAALTRTKVGNTVVGGSTEIDFTVDLSSYTGTAGSYAALHVDLIGYSSTAYRIANGGYGSFSYDFAADKTLHLVS